MWNAYTDIYCSLVGNFWQNQIPPTPVQLPAISGLSAVWWFNGQNPNPAAYPVTVTLTSSAGASTSWSVSQANAKVNLSSTSGASIQVTSTGNYFSGNQGDIQIFAQDTKTGITSPPFAITSSRPWKLVFDSIASGTTCRSGGAGGGYITSLFYDLHDQLDRVMFEDIYWNEAVGAPWNANGSNWKNYGIQTQPGSTGPLLDQLSGPAVNNSPPPSPLPTCHTPPVGTTPYMKAPQNIQVGSSSQGSGVFVQQDNLTYYIDNGAHTSIVVPPKPPL